MLDLIIPHWPAPHWIKPDTEDLVKPLLTA